MPFLTLGPYSLDAFEARPVWLYGPPGDHPHHLRPMLVLLDGQNAFEHGPAGGWESHRALDAWAARSENAPRIVAIPHAADRAAELCAWPVWNGGAGGRALDFIDAVARSILPDLRQRLVTPEGALGVAIGGASWGGAAALVAHYARPDVFGGAICLSPSLWVGHLAVFGWVAARPVPSLSRVWLDCGRHESGGRMFPLVERMAGELRARGYTDRQLRWRPDEHGEHSEASWRRRFPEALEFMYGA